MYRDRLGENLELRLKNGEWDKDGDVDRKWIQLRTVIKETAEEVCGKKIVREGDGRKRTAWWSEEI
jgi:hypothetical protein